MAGGGAGGNTLFICLFFSADTEKPVICKEILYHVLDTVKEKKNEADSLVILLLSVTEIRGARNKWFP